MTLINRSRWRRFLIGVAASLLAQTLSTRADEPHANRWAIVSNLSPKNTKCVDLLTAKFTNVGHFQLVERDDAEAATREADLQMLSDASAAGRRTKLGKRLAADVLLILDERSIAAIDTPGQAEQTGPVVAKATNEKQETIRVVICDVRSGARVFIEGIPTAGRTIEQLVDRIYEIAGEAQKRLSGGIQYVVSVSPFLSQDLKHDFDRFQSVLAQLLEDDLSAIRGVVVVEREEAKAIWDELADQSHSSPVRAVPLMIEGEYKIGQEAEKQEPTADVTVTYRLPGTAARTFHTDSTAISELPRWLASLSNGLIEIPDKNGKPLAAFDAQEQFDRLVQRAEAFSKLGEWHHVQGLRQAALMLKPMDAENRMKLFNNQQLLLRSAAGIQPTPTWVPVAEEARLQKLLSIYKDELANAEFLIRNGQINKRQAALLIGWHEHSYGQLGLTYVPDAASATTALEEVEQARKDFLWRVAPLAFELPDDPADKDDEHRQGALIDIQDALVSQAVRPINRAKPAVDDLDFLYKLWTTRIPDKLGFVGVVASIRYQLFPESEQLVKSRLQPTHFGAGGSSVSRDEWAGFLDRMVKSDHQTVRVIGKVERLIWQWYLIDRNSLPNKVTELQSELDDVAKELEQYPIQHSLGRRTTFGGAEAPNLFEQIRWQIERLKYASDPYADRRRLEARKPQPIPSAVGPGAERPYSSGRVTLKKLPFAIPVTAFTPAWSPSTYVNLRYQGPHWTAWDTDIDLVWNSREIWWMKKPGEFAQLEISAEGDKIIEDAQPHGKLLWVAVRKAGIWVLDKSGNTVRHITEADGLPPSEHALRVYPIEDRKAVAVGSFGKEDRAWCATVDISGETPIVKVFHEAREVIARTGTDIATSPNLSKMPDATFIPVALIPHTTSDEKNVLYVNRDRTGSIYSGGGALVIDLASLGVSAAPMPKTMRSQCGDEAECFISHRGELLHSSVLTGFHSEDKQPRFPVDGQAFVKTKDKIFLPTRTGWDEFDLENDSYRNLCDPAVPLHRLASMRFAPSAHYGIVGWEYDPLRREAHPNVYQVCIDDAKPEPAASKSDKSTAESPPESVEKPSTPDTKGAAPFALSDEQKRDMVGRIDLLLTEEPKLSNKTLTLFSDGIAHLDGWLPQLQPQLCYLDPPEERGGFKWVFDTGRLIRVESLNAEGPRETYTIWHDKAGEPILVRRTAVIVKPVIPRPVRTRPASQVTAASPAAKERAEKEQAQGLRSGYQFGIYDDRNALSRVVFMDSNLNVQRINAFEVAGNYQRVKMYDCDSGGHVKSSIDFPVLNEKGQKVDASDPSKWFYSFHHEEVIATTRAGLEPYYPLPKDMNSSEDSGTRP